MKQTEVFSHKWFRCNIKRYVFLAVIMLIVPISVSGQTKSPATGRPRSLSGDLMDSIVRSFYKVNLCLDVQTPVSLDIIHKNSVISIKQECKSNSNDYIKSHLLEIDIFSIDLDSVDRCYEDNRIVILDASEGAHFYYSWIKKYILPPYTSTSNTEYLRSVNLSFQDKESAESIRRNLKQAIK